MSLLRELIDTSFCGESASALEAAGYSSECNYPVFILLTRGHSPLSKIITGATGDQFSHASIAFNPELDPLYSFGTKKINGNNRELGFIISSPHNKLWGTIPCKYSVYVTFVNKENYEKMQSRLQYFIKNKDSLKYDFSGLVRIFFNIKSKNQTKYFCSRFVAEILSQGRSMEKDPSLYRPDTLKGIGGTCLMMEGDSIQDYDENEAKKAFDKVKKAPESVISILESLENI